ncbi:hypothetical protein HD806DRAFT_508535 [Xylariaceae sp. AK1471]|nr:hypothetical protein HD806DRAFT_508535 [Xylariaceae sp. AK1471]
MAEALGIAASGIAVAQITTQVGTAVVKLKRLWDEVKNVPDDITYLMQQIECLDPVLWAAENSFIPSEMPSSLWDDVAAKRSTELCHKALSALTDLVDDLSLKLNHPRRLERKVAAIKIALKKDAFSKLEKQLEFAVRMLTLSQQTYVVALTRVQPDIILQRFVRLTASSTQETRLDLPLSKSHDEDQRDLSIQKNREPITRNLKGTAVSDQPGQPKLTVTSRIDQGVIDHRPYDQIFLLRLPHWLSRRSWELQSSKANGCWKFIFRSYWILPNNSEVHLIAEKGRPKDLQRLFDLGLASPYDSCRRGLTLLDRAVAGSNFDMVRYLLSVGVDPLGTNVRRIPAWRSISRASKDYRYTEFFDRLFSDSCLVRQFMVLLPPEEDSLADLRSPSKCFCRCGLYNLRIYRSMLYYQCPFHHETPVKERMESAWYASHYSITSPAVFKEILQPDWSANFKALCGLSGPSSLIYIIAVGLSISTLKTSLYSSTWSSLVGDAIRGGANVHGVSKVLHYPPHQRGPVTPLLGVIYQDLFRFPTMRGRVARKLPVNFFSLRTWLSALKAAGIDLTRYGRKEQEMLVKGKVSRYLQPHPQQRSSAFYDKPRSRDPLFVIYGFRYGSEPEDWEVYWAQCTEEYAREFWEYIENLPLQIPGAWPGE